MAFAVPDTAVEGPFWPLQCLLMWKLGPVQPCGEFRLPWCNPGSTICVRKGEDTPFR